jgi:pimeloyl-ACP methyl ester carboxylesterase
VHSAPVTTLAEVCQDPSLMDDIPGIERDLKRVIKGLDTRYTNEAADRLGQFNKPALIAWPREDKFFEPAHAERLVQDLPNARLEWIENARSLSPEDEPGRLAELIASFVREPAPNRTA